MLLDESDAPGAVHIGDASSGESIDRSALGWQIAAVPTPDVSLRVPAPLALSGAFHDPPGADADVE